MPPVPAKNVVRETVYLERDEAEKVRVEAFKRRITKSALIREAIRSLLKIED
jgi:Ribbon-helix-helix protein, copG family